MKNICALDFPLACVEREGGLRARDSMAVRVLEREKQCTALFASGEVPPPPAPIALDTPEQRRAFYLRLMLQSDFPPRRIVHFL